MQSDWKCVFGLKKKLFRSRRAVKNVDLHKAAKNDNDSLSISECPAKSTPEASMMINRTGRSWLFPRRLLESALMSLFTSLAGSFQVFALYYV